MPDNEAPAPEPLSQTPPADPATDPPPEPKQEQLPDTQPQPEDAPAQEGPAEVKQEGDAEAAAAQLLGAGAGEDGLLAAGSDESDEWTEGDNHEMKRVKVYELVGARWVDQGTAFCSGHFDENTNEAFLIARSEVDYSNVILTTTIRGGDVYQRQQETLIVWTEPDGMDYALSFQDPEGCAEVWNFIVEVQRMMSDPSDQFVGSSSPVIGPEPSITTASIIRSGRLPTPQVGNVEDIDRAIKSLARQPSLKERVVEHVQSENYIKHMIDLASQCEDLESLENLHALCGLMQTLLMLNDHTLFEHILEDDLFFGVLGMLEYDPEFPTYKANYREFLQQISAFHQPVAIRDESIRRKVHHTYRLQFLKDVVLARAVDDATFNVLNSCILFNQIDIINYVQTDHSFLRDVVALFIDDPNTFHPIILNLPDAAPDSAAPAAPPPPAVNGDTDTTENKDERRRQVLVLLQHLCATGKSVQLPQRMAMFRTLVDRGVLAAVQWGLPRAECVQAAGDVLAALLDHDLNGVRGHIVKQVQGAERAGKLPELRTVLGSGCGLMAASRDLAVQSLVGDSLKMMLEIQQDADQHPAVAVKMLARAKDDPGTEKFLDYFYKHCIEALIKPFWDIPEWRSLNEQVIPLSREKTNLYLYLCDLLCNFAHQHSFRSHFFMLSSNVAARVATLLSARDKHLRLAAFRFFRVCLKLNNRNLINHLMKHDVLKPILALTIRESRRDNLLSSSCQEFFEHMRRENIKDLIAHCMTKHEQSIRKLAETPLGGPRFRQLIRRWEMNNEPPPPEEAKPATPKPDTRTWGQGKIMETEEEDYFNGDDDDAPSAVMSPLRSPSIATSLKRKRARGGAMPMRHMAPRPATPTPPITPPLGSLVDYDDDDEPAVGALGNSPRPGAVQRKLQLQPPSPTDAIASPRLSHRPMPLRARAASEDEDDILESLLNRSGASSPVPSKLGTPMLGIGISAKRRREDEEDDLERLSKVKRPSLQRADSGESGTGGGDMGSPNPGEDPPKKLKLKFGAVGATVAGQNPPDPGQKDGDGG